MPVRHLFAFDAGADTHHAFIGVQKNLKEGIMGCVSPIYLANLNYGFSVAVQHFETNDLAFLLWLKFVDVLYS